MSLILRMKCSWFTALSPRGMSSCSQPSEPCYLLLLPPPSGPMQPMIWRKRHSHREPLSLVCLENLKKLLPVSTPPIRQTDLLARVEQAGKKQFPFAMSFYLDVTRSHYPYLRWVFLFPIIWSQENPSQAAPAACASSDSRSAQVDTQG